MLVLIISLICLAVVAAVAGHIRYTRLKGQVARGEIEKMPEVKMVTDCGADSCAVESGGLCELDCILQGAGQAEYYDDEELDRFKGKEGNDYSEEEEQEFRNIFESMLPGDVAGWTRSLQQRGVMLPDGLKDEVWLVLGERIHN